MLRQANFKHLNLIGQRRERPRLGLKTMQRFGMMIRLKPGSAERYKRYHAAVWPEVLSMIHECKIRNKEGEWWAEMEEVFHLD